MKLRAPPGCTVVSHAGGIYPVKADGSLEVDDDVAAALIAHGFLPWTRPVRAGSDTRKAEPGKAPGVQHPVSSGNAAPDFPDIDHLNRPALFALLRGKNVRVSLPITNDELRALARRALSASV